MNRETSTHIEHLARDFVTRAVGVVVAVSTYAYRAADQPALQGVALRGTTGRRLQAAA